jgi:hypothetical protein
MNERPDVLVVGAGPIGMALALQAAEHGARVRIVERRTDAFRPSRAMIVHPRTLEVLRPLGVACDLLAGGDTSPRVLLHLGARTVPMGLAQLALTDTAFPHRSPRGSACCRSCSPTTAAARCPRMAIHRDPGAPGPGTGCTTRRWPATGGRPGSDVLARPGVHVLARGGAADGYIGFSIGRADGDALRAGSRGLVRSNERRSSPETRLPADSGWPRRRDRGLQYPPIRSTGLMAEIGAAVRVAFARDLQPSDLRERTASNALEPAAETTWVKALQVQFLSARR